MRTEEYITLFIISRISLHIVWPFPVTNQKTPHKQSRNAWLLTVSTVLCTHLIISLYVHWWSVAMIPTFYFGTIVDQRTTQFEW